MRCLIKKNKSTVIKFFLVFLFIILAATSKGMVIENTEPSIELIRVTGITPHVFEIVVSDVNGIDDIASVKVKVVFAEDVDSFDGNYTSFPGMGFYSDAGLESSSKVTGVYSYELNVSKEYEEKVYRISVNVSDKESSVVGSHDFDFSRGRNLITGAAVFDVTFLKDGWNNIVQSIKRVFEWIKRR